MSKTKPFEIDEENNAGGCSYCWVTKKKDGYYLYGNELGEMSGPCQTVCDAVTDSGFQFGMDYVAITCSIDAAELRAILTSPSFLLENVSSIHVNGNQVADVSVEGIVRAL